MNVKGRSVSWVLVGTLTAAIAAHAEERPEPLPAPDAESAGMKSAGFEANATHYTVAQAIAALGHPTAGAPAIIDVQQYGNQYQAAVSSVIQGGFPMEGSSYLVVSAADARVPTDSFSYVMGPCEADATFGTLCDLGGVDVLVQLPANATTLEFDYRYFAHDYSPFEDPFQVFVIGNSGSVKIAQASLTSEFGTKYASGFQWAPTRRHVTASVSQFAGQVVRLRFRAANRYDHSYPAGALVDNLVIAGVQDSLPPVVKLNALPQYTNQTTLTVSGTATDNRGVTSAQLLRNGTVVANLALNSSGQFSASVNIGEGLNTLVVRAWDAAGNIGSTSAKVTRDTVPPQVLMFAPYAGQAFGSSSIPLSAQIIDQSPTSVYGANIEFYFPAGGGTLSSGVIVLTEGARSVGLSVWDEAGNYTVTQVPIVVDFSAPLLSTELEDNVAFGPLASHLLPFTLHVDDLTATTATFSSGATFSLPAGGGVLQAAFPLQEGVNTVSVQVIDSTSDGVTHTSSLSRRVTYDLTAPVGAFSAPSAEAAVRGQLELSIEASDALTGVASVSVQLDDQPAALASQTAAGLWVHALDTSALADGSHTATATMTDLVGNSAVITRSFVVDNTAPAVVIQSPGAGAYLHQTITVSAKGSDATSGVAKVELFVNGNSLGTCASATCQLPFDTTTLADGPFQVTATAIDAAGNEAAPVLVQAISDNSAPKRFLVSPLPGAPVTSSVSIAVNVDDANFDQVECSVDGVSLGASSNPAFSKTVDTLDKLDGEHVVECSARDLAGNVGTEAATVRVKNWTEALNPRTLNLRSSGEVVTLYVEGVNAALLVPIQALSLSLVVPGGSPVPALVHPASSAAGDYNGNGIPDVTLKFDRQALASAIEGGLASGSIQANQPVKVRLFSGSAEVGYDSITVKR